MVILTATEKETNAEEQNYETELLVSMFDDDVSIEDNSVVTIKIKSNHFLLVLRCLYHELYPSHKAPIFTIIDMTNNAYTPNAIDDILLECECSKLFTPGECVVYQWVEYITEYLRSLDIFVSENSHSPGDDKIVVDIVNSANLEDAFNINELPNNLVKTDENGSQKSVSKIYTGGILTERKNHFQAHVSKVFSKDDIENIMSTLLANPKISGASHNYMAYRYVNDSGIIVQDHSNDRETKAGGRLLEMLDIMNVENLMVVVTRWFDNVQLGSARFKCINNIAKTTIMESGFHDSQTDESKKKKKSRFKPIKNYEFRCG